MSSKLLERASDSTGRTLSTDDVDNMENRSTES